MLLNVRIQSNFTAPANGFLELTVDSTQKIQDLIDKFCEAKQIEVSPNFALTNHHDQFLSPDKPISYYGIESGDLVTLTSNEIDLSHGAQLFCGIGIIALVISLGGLIICTSIYLLLTSVPDSYAIVVDAGSTHTEALLYKWPAAKINNTGSVVQVKSCDTRGGIAYVLPKDIPEYLSACMNDIKESIPVDSLPSTEIYLGATAGMRILELKDKSAATQVMDALAQYFETTGFRFQKSHSKIISGSLEGATGWLTLNYLNESLSTNKTTGALDLGGASTQIAFEVSSEDQNITSNSFILPLQIYGKEVNIFSQSFLCYGIVEIYRRYRAHLVIDNLRKDKTGRNIGSPCDHIGFTYDLTTKDIFDSPCTPQLKEQFNSNTTFHFAGTSDSNSCQSTMEYLLSEKFCMDYGLKDCITGANIPNDVKSKSFYGFSGFGYIIRDLNLGENVTNGKFKDEISHRCSLTVADLLVQYVPTYEKLAMTRKELQSLCFKGQFVYTLLTNVYQLESDDIWQNIQFGLKINEKNLGWALGFIVNETGKIASPLPVPGIDSLLYGLLVILFIAFFVFSLAFAIQARRLRKRDSRKYSRFRPAV